jgi:hypothetical protein
LVWLMRPYPIWEMQMNSYLCIFNAVFDGKGKGMAALNRGISATAVVVTGLVLALLLGLVISSEPRLGAAVNRSGSTSAVGINCSNPDARADYLICANRAGTSSSH